MVLDCVSFICGIIILFIFCKICRVARKGGKRRGRTTVERKISLEQLEKKKTLLLSRPLTRFPGRAQAVTSCHLAPSQSVVSGKVTPPMDHEHMEIPNDQAAKFPSGALPGPSQPKKSSPVVLRIFNDIPPTEHPVPRRPSIPERASSPLIQPCPILETVRDGSERSVSLSSPEIRRPLQPRARRIVVPDKSQTDPMSSTSAARAPKSRFSRFMSRLRSCCCCCLYPKRGARKASNPSIPRFRPRNAALLHSFGYRTDLWES